MYQMAFPSLDPSAKKSTISFQTFSSITLTTHTKIYSCQLCRINSSDKILDIQPVPWKQLTLQAKQQKLVL